MTAALPTAPAISDDRKYFLHTLFVTALEGGIDYWAYRTHYHWQKDGADTAMREGCDIDGFRATIKSQEGDWGVSHLGSGYGLAENEALTIDLQVMQRGVALFRRYCHGEIDSSGNAVPEALQTPLHDDHYWRQWLVADATNGNDGDYDAAVADEIVQFGLFGQSVYG